MAASSPMAAPSWSSPTIAGRRSASSALHGARVIYVMTHDSIGLGEDGPTHQPVEHLRRCARSRTCWCSARPTRSRPRNAGHWRCAEAHGPSVLALTRQALPTLRTEHSDENLCARGGYVLAEARASRAGHADRDRLGGCDRARGARPSWRPRASARRVVSHALLGTVRRAAGRLPRRRARRRTALRVAIEAAATFGWERYVGPDGAVDRHDSFGASAPAGDLYKHFGITAEAVVPQARPSSVCSRRDRIMAVRVAINGFGRIGRLVLRAILESDRKRHRGGRDQRSRPGRDQRASAALRHRARAASPAR